MQTAALFRRRSNPWRQLVQTGLKLPVCLREHLRAMAALSGGEVEIQQRVARAVYWYEANGAPLEPPSAPPDAARRLEEAWQAEGGAPGQMEEYRPK